MAQKRQGKKALQHHRLGSKKTWSHLTSLWRRDSKTKTVSEHSPKSLLRGSCMYPHLTVTEQQNTASFPHLQSLLQPFLFLLFSLLLQFFILGQDGWFTLRNLFVEHFCHGICPACIWARFGACCLFNHIAKCCCFIFIITIQAFTSWRVAVFWKSWAYLRIWR